MLLGNRYWYFFCIFSFSIILISRQVQANDKKFAEPAGMVPEKGTAAAHLKLAKLYLSKNYKQAIENADLALSLAKKEKNYSIQADACGIMGEIFFRQNDTKKAIDYYEDELKLREKLGTADSHFSWLCYRIASLYRAEDKTRRAISYYEESLETARKARAHSIIPANYEALFSLYYDIGKSKEALQYFKLYIGVKDSLFKVEKNNEISELTSQFETEGQQKDQVIDRLNELSDLQKQELKTKELEIEKKKQEIKTKELEIAKKKVEQRFLLAVACSVVLVILLLLNLYLSKQRANKKLSVQNTEIQIQKQEIEEKKEIIEANNIEITKSIRYALQIQQAILPPVYEINCVFPESFVLFKPKDIVSGDFYWVASTQNNRTFIAAADCSGHGVPGGFMSMIGIEKLNKIINNSKDLPNLHPARVLEMLDKEIKTSLRQTKEDRSIPDGMDIAMCEFDFKNRKVIFSGANRPLWLIKHTDGNIIEYPPVKRGIGGFYDIDQEYKDEILDISPNDMVYVFSDGYHDQFGGEDNRKLMKKNLKKILVSVHMEEPVKQKETLDNYFNKWKKDEMQVDDILIIGIRYRHPRKS